MHGGAGAVPAPPSHGRSTRRHHRGGRVGGIGPPGLGAQRADLARRVLALQGGQNVMTGTDNAVMELNGLTALVTGGADGIGAGIAERLATEGMHVVIADLDERSGPAMAERI